MLKTLGAQIKEFKAASIATPLYMLLEVAMETIIPLMMASIVDNGVNVGDSTHIYKMGGLMVIAALVSLFAGSMGAKYGAKAAMGLGRNLRSAMFQNIQTYSFANIDHFSTAGLVTRMTTDVTNIQNAYMMLLRMAMRAPASLIFAMAMSFFISPRLAVIYLIAVLILGTLLVLISTLAMKHFRSAFEKYDALNESVQENVSAIRVVKAYVREDYEKNKFTKASKNINLVFTKAENIVVWNTPLMQFTVYTCILLISWIGAHMAVGGSLETGDLMALLTYCMNILMNLMMLSMIFVMVSLSIPSGKRIAEVLNEESTLKNPQNPLWSTSSAVSMMSMKVPSMSAAMMSAAMTWMHSAIRYPWYFSRLFSSPEASTTICAGEIRMLRTRNAGRRAGWRVPMNLSSVFRTDTTHISNRAAPMYRAVRSSVYVLPVPC